MNNLINVRIKIYSFPSFLDYLSLKELYIANVTSINEYEYTFECNYMTYLKLRKVYKEIKIISNDRVVNLFLRLFSEKLVIICLIISSIFYIYLSNLVFHIEIIGDSDYLNQFLLNQLEFYNIEENKQLPTIEELKKIEKDILINNTDKFDIINIIKNGNHIFLNYERKKKSLNIEDTKTKIFSSKDAIISKIIIGKGKVLVTENQFVMQGDLLVDDHLNINGQPHFIGTIGLIYGYTYKKVEFKDYQSEIADLLIQGRYLVSKDYIYEEKILEESIIFHDEVNKNLIIHYKCEEILNSY
jgi:competence protein ComGC